MPLHDMKHESDPAEDIRKAVGDLEHMQLAGGNVLVGTYIRPEKTASGLFLTSGTRKEDEYQGKVGLVMKMGPLAFQDDETHDFRGFKPSEGDWVFYRASDGYQLTINGYHCRLLTDIHIKGRLTRPDVVF